MIMLPFEITKAATHAFFKKKKIPECIATSLVKKKKKRTKRNSKVAYNVREMLIVNINNY